VDLSRIGELHPLSVNASCDRSHCRVGGPSSGILVGQHRIPRPAIRDASCLVSLPPTTTTTTATSTPTGLHINSRFNNTDTLFNCRISGWLRDICLHNNDLGRATCVSQKQYFLLALCITSETISRVSDASTTEGAPVRQGQLRSRQPQQR
jgi:hypothetical protein